MHREAAEESLDSIKYIREDLENPEDLLSWMKLDLRVTISPKRNAARRRRKV
jgi:hypothetical protein